METDQIYFYIDFTQKDSISKNKWDDSYWDNRLKDKNALFLTYGDAEIAVKECSIVLKIIKDYA